MLERGRDLRAETGETLIVKRWDIVPVPEHLRPLLPADRIMDFPVDTAQSIFDFSPDDVIGRIAPRPLLIYHGANDSVTPTSEALEIFRRANGVPELAILAGDHFPFAEPEPLLDGLMRQWLTRNLPIRPSASARGRTRRIVTGTNTDGRSYFVDDGVAPHRFQSEHAPNVAQVMWATDTTPAVVDGQDPATADKFFTAAPAPSGTILRIVDFPPDTEYDAEAMAKFLATIVPEGEHRPAVARHFFFHTTHTLDYAIVLDGEIWALMDEGETLMRQGDVLIQRATSHSWSNRTTRDCKMAFVLIDGRTA
jgi:hypothetical protein